MKCYPKNPESICDYIVLDNQGCSVLQYTGDLDIH